MRPSFLQDLTGQKFGRLTVLRMSEKRTASRGGICICQCECGTIKEIPSLHLKNGAVVSCGCYQKEIVKNKAKHGHQRNGHKTITFISWEKMMQRCYRENAPEYKYYGARGINVCEKWHKFEGFLEDMGERPSKELSLDRIDPNGNYEPRNCRWADILTQTNNTRRNVYYDYKGEKKTIAELARIAGVKYDTMYVRLRENGLTPEQAIKLPTVRWGNKKRYEQALINL